MEYCILLEVARCSAEYLFEWVPSTNAWEDQLLVAKDAAVSFRASGRHQGSQKATLFRKQNPVKEHTHWQPPIIIPKLPGNLL